MITEDEVPPVDELMPAPAARPALQPRTVAPQRPIEPGKLFAGLLSPSETPLAEFNLGRSGLLAPERTKALVTDKSVLLVRKKRYLAGLVPGADVWVSQYPLDAPDLRRIRIFRPSGTRMMLVVLAAVVIGAAFFSAMMFQDAGDPMPFLAEAARQIIADVPEMAWLGVAMERFDVEDFGTWWWTLILFVLAFLWYGIRFRARLETDGFRVGIGRGKKARKAVSDFVGELVVRRIEIQDRIGS